MRLHGQLFGLAGLLCALVAPAVANADISFTSTGYPLPAASGTSPHIQAVSIADLNNDRRGDIVVYRAESTSAGEVIVLLNRGDGSFGTAQAYPTTTCSNDNGGPMVTGQFDAGQAADVIVGCGDGNAGLDELTGNGDGTLAPAVHYAGIGPGTFLTLWPADDGGFPNVLYPGSINNLCYRPANGLGSSDTCLTDTSHLDAGGNPDGVVGVTNPVTAHFYSNATCARDNLIVATQGAAVHFWGLNPFGSSTTAPCSTYAYTSRDVPLPSGFSLSGVTAGDINGDGGTDLLMPGGNAARDHVIALLWQNSGTSVDGGFPPGEQPVITPSIYNVDEQQMADFDGDGHVDAAVDGNTSVSSGAFAVQRGHGDGSFDAPVTFPLPGSDRNHLAVADLNGDGKPDVVSVGDFDGAATVLLNGSVSPTPTIGPSGGGGPSNQQQPPDITAPVISVAGLSNRTFAVGRARTVITARVKRGTTLRYKLSEPARVSIGIARRDPNGRRSGSHCVKATRKLRHARRCTRWASVGTLTRTGVTGANSVAFSGRIGSKALALGSYRLTLSAADAAHNRSKATVLAFTIVKP